jgi:hypothetical protein
MASKRFAPVVQMMRVLVLLVVLLHSHLVLVESFSTESSWATPTWRLALPQETSSPRTQTISYSKVHEQLENARDNTNAFGGKMKPYTSRKQNTGTQLYMMSPQVQQLVSSVFALEGPVPLVQAVGINALLFGVLQSKLFKVLTPEGYISAAILGSGLWHTLGWR